MKHISLFSGIGGFDLAAERMGWENVAHCERNPFCLKVLKYYWPNAETFTDITKSDFTKYANRIDILTGGFPCQPYSLAGKRKGTDDERHLWPEMLRAIREIQPRWVVGENVFGLVNWNGGLVFEQVQADLEAEGYEVFPFLLPAAGVNAPHERYRIWFVAHASRNGHDGTENRCGDRKGNDGIQARQAAVGQFEGCGSETAGEITPHTASERLEKRKWWSTKREGFASIGQTTTTNTAGARQPGEEHGQTQPGWLTEAGIPNDWSNFPTQSPVCTGNDGFSTELLRQRIRDDSMGVISEKEIDKIISGAAIAWRNNTIKAGGNAIVHQVALQIFRAIDMYEKLYA